MMTMRMKTCSEIDIDIKRSLCCDSVHTDVACECKEIGMATTAWGAASPRLRRSHGRPGERQRQSNLLWPAQVIRLEVPDVSQTSTASGSR